ncbi:hypothetical protein Sjap_011231 [Stephania japonica]|uniref:Uncharacterized protein n=1 Tax=Stephania japonica TaxID=461633 RepID=A0AAP0JBA3_9MAGN
MNATPSQFGDLCTQHHRPMHSRERLERETVTSSQQKLLQQGLVRSLGEGSMEEKTEGEKRDGDDGSLMEAMKL